MRNRIYQITAAAYSICMLLYYWLHVIVYRRNDPEWLGEVYFLVMLSPGGVALHWLPMNLKEHTFRIFLKYVFWILFSFSACCMICPENLFIEVKRWLSFGIMNGMFFVFLVLFLYQYNNKQKGI